MDSTLNKINAVIEDSFKTDELKDCFLVDIQLNNTKLEVYIDTDEGVSFTKCRKLSRAIEAYLDEEKLLGEKYILEVSSPGISRPLKFKRQYPRNIGRKIEVTLLDNGKIKGILKKIEDDVLTIESKGQKKRDKIINEIKFDAIKSTKILVTF